MTDEDSKRPEKNSEQKGKSIHKHITFLTTSFHGTRSLIYRGEGRTRMS